MEAWTAAKDSSFYVRVGDADDEVVALRAENAALRAALAEVQRGEQRFRALFEHSADAHLIFDASGILDVNHATLQMLRCADRADLIGHHPAELSPELQPDGRRSLEKSIEMDRIAHERGYHRFEWIHRRMNGEEFPVQVTLTPVTLSTGPALLVVWHELTELRRHEEALRRQAQVIRRLSVPLITVAAGVLLVPIVGALDAERGAVLVEEVLRALESQRARTVIVDLTGVEDFDAMTAEHLLRLAAATRLLGADAVLTGIRPEVARRLVELGTELRGLRAMRDVAGALARVLDASRSG